MYRPHFALTGSREELLIQGLSILYSIKVDQHPLTHVICIGQYGPQGAIHFIRIVLVPGNGLQFSIQGKVGSGKVSNFGHTDREGT